MRTSTTRETSGTDVLAWRREQLVQTGFPVWLATQVSRDLRYDLHVLIELVEAGCPPPLAVRILAPLDEGGPV